MDTVLRAHAQLYHFYHEQIKGTGKVGMKYSNLFGVPLDPLNASHVEAANNYDNLDRTLQGRHYKSLFDFIDFIQARTWLNHSIK